MLDDEVVVFVLSSSEILSSTTCVREGFGESYGVYPAPKKKVVFLTVVDFAKINLPERYKAIIDEADLILKEFLI